jgi:hypothetical protein
MSIFTLAALLAQSLPAPGAAQWEPFGPPQPGMTNQVDPASIVRSGDRVSLRVRTSRAAPAPDGMSSAVAAFTIDCRARTAQLDGLDLYRADGSFGRSLPGDDAVPVSNGDPMQRALFERACRPAAPAPSN